MRAAVLRQPGAAPEPGTFDDPRPDEGQAVVEVAVAGLNPVDLAMASGAMGEPTVPSVVGREGVGTLPDGRRVYFNSPVRPYGSWAERALVDPEQAFPVADGVDDDLAVAMGIPGLAAWLPLEWHARLKAGERVLVLGATGVVGQIAVQAAKVLGAGHVVAAARDAEAMERLTGGLGADAAVVLGQGDDAEALKAQAGDGYDVVIDPVYGAPFVAALEATAVGARLVTIGQSAGGDAEVPLRSLMGRVHFGHGNQLTPPEVQRAAYEKLTRHAAAGDITVEVQRFRLDQAAEAWEAQQAGPHKKLVVVP